jgi:glycosyltransferase involved in cell wall biosynthesis
MEKTHLSVLVALHTGNLSGVETYAEQIASSAAAASHDVTLIAVGQEVADAVNRRLGDAGVRVLATAAMSRAGWRSAARQVPTLALMEMETLLVRTLQRLGDRFDVAHLNHPALAGAARDFAGRVVAGAWFYPHSPRARFVETWRHTGAVFPKSAGLAVKSLSHYWNDRQGYAASDCVVAPTQLLTDQLNAIGITAIACPPPGRSTVLTGTDPGREPDLRGGRRIVICCGDMSHPRKNVRAGIRAVELLAKSGRQLDLELIGSRTEGLMQELHALPASVRVMAPGRQSREQVDERLGIADLLLVPSLYEEWGYVATEALLSGTPVVAFPVYPFVEILQAPLGRSAADMTPAALAAAIEEVLDGKPNRLSIRSAAEQRFGAEAVGARLSQIWGGGAQAEEPALVVAAGSVAR